LTFSKKEIYCKTRKMKTARTTILNAHSFACFTCPHTREKGVFAFFSSLFVVLSH